jgi:restriction endonuclease S subunit
MIRTKEQYEKLVIEPVEEEEKIEKEYDQLEFEFDEISSEESARVELKADMARERARERIQMEMYDDPYLNWSGHR